MDWTEARTAAAIEMWEGGTSATVIAERIGGVTRNAVIGKIHRLGLRRTPAELARCLGGGGRQGRLARAAKAEAKGKKASKGPRPRPFLERRQATQGEQAAAYAAMAAVMRRIAAQPDVLRMTRDGAVASIIDLDDQHCRYPIGEPRRGWCAAAAIPGLPYCEVHAARCYRLPVDTGGLARHAARIPVKEPIPA